MPRRVSGSRLATVPASAPERGPITASTSAVVPRARKRLRRRRRRTRARDPSAALIPTLVSRVRKRLRRRRWRTRARGPSAASVPMLVLQVRRGIWHQHRHQRRTRLRALRGTRPGGAASTWSPSCTAWVRSIRPCLRGLRFTSRPGPVGWRRGTRQKRRRSRYL
jgi:hypothetical protein